MKYKLLIHLTFLLFIGLLIFSCEKDDFRVKPTFSLNQEDQIEDEEYKIYSIVIDKFFRSDKVIIKQASNFAIDLFYGNDYYEDLINEFPDFDTNLVVSHWNNNNINNSVNFSENFQSDSLEIILITDEELNFIFDYEIYDNYYDQWLEFYHYYPYSSGLVSFSRISFNEDNTQAVLEMGQTSGSLSGTGLFIHLEKIDNKWTIIKEILTWIS